MGSKITNRRNADGSLRTPEQWRAMAAESRKRSADSWERSDTDGFLSQWASDTVAREYEAWAELAESNYQAEFPALFDLDGNPLDARQIESRYGWCWLIKNSDGTVKFFNESQARSGKRRLATDMGKGFRLGTVSREAYVKLHGASYTSVSPVAMPYPASEVTIVDDGSLGTQYQDFA